MGRRRTSGAPGGSKLRERFQEIKLPVGNGSYKSYRPIGQGRKASPAALVRRKAKYGY